MRSTEQNGLRIKDGETDCQNRHDNKLYRPGLQEADWRMTPEEKVDKLICEAEAAKGQVYGMTGRIGIKNNQPYQFSFNKERIHSMLVDEEYSVIGSHLDDMTIEKIKAGQYVDFAKLLPRDKLAIEEDNRLQLVVKDGQVFWQPPTNSGNMGNISSYYRWEQAFKVYSNVYTKAYSHCASELIQYSHDIHAASLTYI